MSEETTLTPRTEKEFEYDCKRAARGMRKQVAAFAMMILFTFVAFAAVQAGFPANFIGPVILLLAGVQVALQFYFFMHWDEKGSGTAQFFMYSAILVAFTMVLTFVTIIWWGE